MKVRLSVRLADDLWREMLRVPHLAKLTDTKWPKPAVVTWPSKGAEELFDIAARTGGARAIPSVELGEAETPHISHFVLEPKTLCPMTSNDTTWFLERRKEMELHKRSTGRTGHFETFRISRRPCKPRSFTGPDGTPVFFASGDVAESLTAAGLKGVEWGPVLKLRDDTPHPNCNLLIGTTVAPPMTHNPSIWAYESEGLSALHCHGFFSYASGALESVPDIAQTLEPTDGTEFSKFIVSGRFRAAVEDNSIGGLRFVPVLTVGTPAFRAFVACWNALTDAVCRHELNHLGWRREAQPAVRRAK